MGNSVRPAGLVAGVNVMPDDLSSLIAFGGNRIGVMCSNQNTQAMFFAVHRHGQPDTSSGADSQRRTGACKLADDHINLKAPLTVAERSRARRGVTSRTGNQSPGDLLLLHAPKSDTWSSQVVSRVSDHLTRPIVLVDETRGFVHVFAAAEGVIYEKSASLTRPRFHLGRVVAVMREASGSSLRSSTSTKRSVGPMTGLVLLASSRATLRYWHMHRSLRARR